ncbi:MAG TPA: hypothetical protein VM142_04840 [Acidimicrobiales bacterium]|nr:hypothetical protein [Acidimicrobiales bacterium]
MVFTWLVTLLAALVGFSAPAAAAHYPLAPLTNPAGVAICDVIGDVNPGQADIACDAAGASAYIGSDGTTITAGLVLTRDPRATGTEAPLEGFTWQVAIGVGGAQVATMGISGKGTNNTDFLYVMCSGKKTTPHYTVNATQALANGTIAVTSTGSYFLLTFNVPLSALAPCGVISSTGVQLFFGTSQANELDVINKDYFTGTGLNFTVVPPISFGGTLDLTKTATAVSGPNPPVLGQTTTYDLVVTAKNPSAYALSGVSVTDTLPDWVAIQSPLTASVDTASATGQTVTWSGFGLVAGASETLTIPVSVTPTATDVGSAMLLNPGASGTATRVAGSGTVSDTSEPVSTATVLGPRLGVTKTVSPSTVGPGDVVTYTVTLSSTGTSAATVTSVVDTLPTGFTFVAGSTTGTLLGASAPTVALPNVTWTGSFAIPAGESRTLVFRVVAASAPGTYDNVVQATAEQLSTASTGPTATVTVVPKADLSITKTDAPDPVMAGDNLTYTIVVSNAGPSPATGVTVTDTLPDGVTFVPASSTAGCTLLGSTVSCLVGTVNVGSPATVTIVVTTLTAGALTNTASVGADTVDPNAGNNSSTATTNVNPTTANLSVTKTASPATAVAGENLTYALAVSNAGPGTAPNVRVTDVLPAGLTFVSATDPGCSYDSTIRTLTCTAATLAPGFSTSFSVVTTVDPAQTASLSNTATVSSAIPDPVAAGDRVTLVTPVVASADVSVTLSDAPDPVTAGGSLVYGLTVRNAGPSNAATVVVTDTLPPEVTFVSAPDCTYNPATTTVRCAAGTLAPGGSASFAVTVQVGPGVTGTIRDTATVTTTTTDSNSANDTDTEITTVAVIADLAAIKVAGVPTATPGGTLTYTLGVTNAGPSTATNVQITDALPAELAFVSAAGCTYAAISHTLTCSVGNVAVGPGPTRTVVTTVDPAATGSVTNTASASSAAAVDLNSTNNAATAVVALTPSADLVASVSATPDPVTAGQALSVVAGVTNAGPSTATTVVVATTLPTALTPAFLPAGCTFSAPTVTCTRASLAPGGGPVTFTIPTTVAAGAPAGSTLSLATAVTSATADPAANNNRASTSVTVRSDNDLSVTLADSPDPVVAGALLTYTATATNTGPSTATGVEVTLTIPPGVTLAPASVPTGCSYAGGPRLLTCTLGTRATGSAPPVLVVVSVDPATTSVLSATATVRSISPDSVPDNNTDTATTTVTTSANLSLAKVATPSPVVPGTDLTYDLVVTNNGPSTATGVTVTDVLPVSLSAPRTPLPTGCGYDPTTSTLSCVVATLAPGTTATRTFVVTVDPATTTSVFNTATVTSAVPDPTAGDNVARARTPVAPSADLAASVSATPDPATAGLSLSVVAGVTNAGPSTANAVVVATTLPAALTPGTLPAGCTFAAPTLTCVVGTLAPGGAPVTFTTPTTVAPATPAGTTLALTTVVGSTTVDPVVPNNTATAAVPVLAVTDLAITKTANPSPVTAGTALTYTITVTNNGPSTASDVDVTDVLPAALSAPQAPLPAGCTYAAGTHTVTCRLTGLAPGASTTRTIVATVDATFVGAIANTASVLPLAGSATDPVLADNTSTAGVNAVAPVVVPPRPQPSADLEVDISATPDPVTAGQPLDVVVGVTNNGPDTATSVVVSVALPTSLTPGELPSGCTYEAAPDRVVRCSTASLAPHQTARFSVAVHGPGSASFAFFAVVAPGTPAGTVLSLLASVVSAVFDPVAANNQATAQVTVAGAGVLSPVTSPAPSAITTDPVTAAAPATTDPVTSAAPATTGPTGVSTVFAVAPAQVETQVLPSVLTSPARSSSVEIVGGPAALATATTPAVTVVTRSAAAGVGGTGALAVTGAPSLTMATWGLSLIGVGLVLRVGNRRRRKAAVPAPAPARPKFVL